MKAQLFLLALVGMFLTERFPVASKVCAVIVVLVIGEKVVWFVQHRRRFARLVHSHGQICIVWLYLICLAWSTAFVYFWTSQVFEGEDSTGRRQSRDLRQTMARICSR